MSSALNKYKHAYEHRALAQVELAVLARGLVVGARVRTCVQLWCVRTCVRARALCSVNARMRYLTCKLLTLIKQPKFIQIREKRDLVGCIKRAVIMEGQRSTLGKLCRPKVPT